MKAKYKNKLLNDYINRNNELCWYYVSFIFKNNPFGISVHNNPQGEIPVYNIDYRDEEIFNQF